MPATDDDLHDWEYPDDTDFGDDDSSASWPCPECGQEVYDDAELCPHCGMYIIPDTNPLRGQPPAWIVLGLVGMAAVIAALLLF